MDTNAQPIQFILAGITTEQFAVVQEAAYSEGSPALIHTSFSFAKDSGMHMVRVFAHFRFEQENQTFMIVQGGCHFQITAGSWPNLVQADGSLTIPRDVMVHFAMLTVGTVRGILHSKTENTVYNRMVIPPINILNSITSDIAIH